MRFSNRIVAERVQTFWAAMSRGEFIGVASVIVTATGEILRGDVPDRALRMARESASMHRDEPTRSTLRPDDGSELAVDADRPLIVVKRRMRRGQRLDLDRGVVDVLGAQRIGERLQRRGLAGFRRPVRPSANTGPGSARATAGVLQGVEHPLVGRRTT